MVDRMEALVAYKIDTHRESDNHLSKPEADCKAASRS
jgi:hypothetical protein